MSGVLVELVGGQEDGRRLEVPVCADGRPPDVVIVAKKFLYEPGAARKRNPLPITGFSTIRYLGVGRRHGTWRYVLEGSRDLW